MDALLQRIMMVPSIYMDYHKEEEEETKTTITMRQITEGVLFCRIYQKKKLFCVLFPNN
jgi:hypothetical protein